MQSLMNETSALIRRDMREVISLSDMGEHRWKASICKSGREPSPEIELDLDLKLPSLQNCEKCTSVVQTTRPMIFCYKQPELTKTANSAMLVPNCSPLDFTGLK